MQQLPLIPPPPSPCVGLPPPLLPPHHPPSCQALLGPWRVASRWAVTRQLLVAPLAEEWCFRAAPLPPLAAEVGGVWDVGMEGGGGMEGGCNAVRGGVWWRHALWVAEAAAPQGGGGRITVTSNSCFKPVPATATHCLLALPRHTRPFGSPGAAGGLLQGWSRGQLLVLLPAVFGAAHLHGALEARKRGAAWGQALGQVRKVLGWLCWGAREGPLAALSSTGTCNAAAHLLLLVLVVGPEPCVGCSACLDIPLQALFQAVYTSLFGAYATWLLLVTGSLAAPVAAHVACNALGVPDFGAMAADNRWPLLRVLLWAGIAGFVGSFSLMPRLFP